MTGCRDCEQLASGDCGKHGPTTSPLEAEVARLRGLLHELAGLLADHCPDGWTMGHGEYPCGACRQLRDLRERVAR